MKYHKVPQYRKQVRKYSPPRAFCEVEGKRFYFGLWGTPRSRELFQRFIAERLAKGLGPPDNRGQLTIAELVAKFWNMPKYGTGGPMERIPRRSVFIVVSSSPWYAFGSIPASEFSPNKLKTVRETMIQAGRFRSSINNNISRLKHVFKWAVENELIKPEVYQALAAVSGLQRGRCEAPESEPVRTVPEAHIQAVQPYVSRQVWAIIQLQLATAARPGELLPIKGSQIDRTGTVWLYRPTEHKDSFRGKERVIYIGLGARRS